MGLSGSGINEENHIVNGSWIAWLIDDSIGDILSVPFCPLSFCPRTRYNGVHQTPTPRYLDSFIITVLCKDIFHAMITKIGFMAHPRSESIYLMKFIKSCTQIVDTQSCQW